MAAGFSITISAIDSASGVIDSVNRRLASIHAPVERLGKQLSAFGRLTGITGIVKGFDGLAKNAFAAFENVARIVGPLSAITGAASLVGMYRMVEAWGTWGSQLGWAAQRIGLSAAQLSIFQGAALLGGASVGTMTTGLQALGQSMYDAIGGRAPATVALFNQLGIAFDDGTRHARSVAAVMPELADKIASIKDPYTQARVAAQLFGGAAEELLPFLRRGSAGIADLERRSAHYGVTTQAGVAAANRLREAQADLILSVQGLGNSISERLGPILSPLLDQMAELIAKNRLWIATGIGNAVKEFAGYVKTIDWKGVEAGFENFAKRADAVAQAFGGWKRVLEGIVAIKLAGWAFAAIAPFTSVLRLLALVPGSGVTVAALAAVGIADYAVGDNVGTQGGVRNDHTAFGRWIYDNSSALRYADNWLWGSGNPRADAPTSEVQRARVAKAIGAFEIAGFSPAQASGPAANMIAESGMNPFAVNGSHYGIGQWDSTRQADYAKLYGHTMQSVKDQSDAFQEQVKFYRYELTIGSHKAVGDKLRSTNSGYQAGVLISQEDESPNDPTGSEASRRGGIAQSLFDALPVVKDGELGDAQTGSAGASGKVDLNVHVTGAQVQSTRVRTQGNVNPPKIATTNVGGSPAP